MFICTSVHLTINARYMKYIPQYVYYNLLAHILFLTSSYVLVSILYTSLRSSNFVLKPACKFNNADILLTRGTLAFLPIWNLFNPSCLVGQQPRVQLRARGAGQGRAGTLAVSWFPFIHIMWKKDLPRSIELFKCFKKPLFQAPGSRMLVSTKVSASKMQWQ